MPSRSRENLNEIRRLIEHGSPDKTALSKEEFNKYLDPEDPFFNQITGGKKCQ